jgi:hypothetical protein
MLAFAMHSGEREADMKRLIAPILIVALALSGTAHAKKSQRVIYTSIVATLLPVALGLLAGGIALHYKAPDADTLQNFKREDSAGNALMGVGGAILAPTAIFTVVGALTFDLSREDRAQISPAPTGSGMGLALGGRF